jgi:hypothetical protein
VAAEGREKVNVFHALEPKYVLLMVVPVLVQLVPEFVLYSML